MKTQKAIEKLKQLRHSKDEIVHTGELTTPANLVGKDIPSNAGEVEIWFKPHTGRFFVMSNLAAMVKDRSRQSKRLKRK